MIPDTIPEQNAYLNRVSQQLENRHKLAQSILKGLKNFGEGPASVDVPPNYTMEDIKAIKPIFERDFRVEVRFAGSRTHMRFYKS